MSPRASGARRILLYNWPVFVLTWTAAAVAAGSIAAIGFERLGIAGRFLAIAGIAGVLWSLVALVVSHVVYDRSELAGASWVAPLLPPSPATSLRWVAIDAGLDEEVALDQAIASPCTARLDIHDGTHVGTRSLARARALTPRARTAMRASALSLPLADRSCDLVAMVFTAHEIRTRRAREACFLEVARALAPRGRLLLVEHLRDLPNTLAYGPGAWHFLPRREWLALAERAGLRVADERRVTPWVTALAFERVG
jgi:SAM-dependent methyltransferase